VLNRLIDANRALWGQFRPKAHRNFSPRADRLAHLVNEFEQALLGVSTPTSQLLRRKIQRAKSKSDLWYYRTDVFDIVSHAFGQWEAESRLDRLNDLFESTGSRSGSIPL
jgi:hypothetical protein